MFITLLIVLTAGIDLVLGRGSWSCLSSLPEDKICDCFSDCADESDEQYCSTEYLFTTCCFPAAIGHETRPLSSNAESFCRVEQYLFEPTGLKSAELQVIRPGVEILRRKKEIEGFMCDGDQRKIPYNYVCDGQPDCTDKSDENDQLCSMMRR